jgi:hypothetical protein
MSASDFAQDILVMTWKQGLTKLKETKIIIGNLVVMSSNFSLMGPKGLDQLRDFILVASLLADINLGPLQSDSRT